MIETPHDILEGSFRIAWDYLEATGELGERNRAVRFLLDNIGAAMNRGEFRNCCSPIAPSMPTGAGRPRGNSR
jgi:hypothetical protein